MKLLFIRFSSIGDIVLTTPVLRCTKLQVKEVEIHYLLKRSYGSVLDHNPYVDKKIFLEDNLKSVLEELQKEKYDYIIDLHKNIRSLRVKNALDVKSFSFDKLNFEKWLMVNMKINILPKIHIVDRYMKAVERLGVVNDGNGLDYFVSVDDEKVLNDLPATYRNKFIAWVIGARHNTKMLPVDKMISIGKNLNAPVVLLGGTEDVIRGETLQASDEKKFFNACGKYSINQSAAFIKHAKKVITHDTGLMHIAAAFQKTIISVWGNTIPEFGMEPYFGEQKTKSKIQRSVIAEVKDLNCRPCTKIGFEKCPKGHFKCMFDQSEIEIFGD